jgi:hypothetical protein
VDNVLQTDATKERGLYREITVGTKLNIQGILLLYFDPHYVPDLPTGERLGHESGVELVLMSDFFLRAGMLKNASVPFLPNRSSVGYGIGLGWMAPRLSLDYGLSRIIDPMPATAHNFGATIYF